MMPPLGPVLSGSTDQGASFCALTVAGAVAPLRAS